MNWQRPGQRRDRLCRRSMRVRCHGTTLLFSRWPYLWRNRFVLYTVHETSVRSLRARCSTCGIVSAKATNSGGKHINRRRRLSRATPSPSISSRNLDPLLSDRQFPAHRQHVQEMIMRPTQLRHRAAVPALFVSCKCEIGVPIQHQPLLRCALERAALDPAVQAIRYRTGPIIECPALSLHGVVLYRIDGCFLLRVYETRPERSEDQLARLTYVLQRYGLRLLERDSSEIRRELLFTNSRLVWSYARRPVSLSDRLRIGLALEEWGPQSLAELEARARPSCDIVAALCALACADLVSLNIHHVPLGRFTVASAR
ncbi:hypothetical protein ACVISU_004957 [Bradyrhizobium sp. USDA 4452]